MKIFRKYILIQHWIIKFISQYDKWPICLTKYMYSILIIFARPRQRHGSLPVPSQDMDFEVIYHGLICVQWVMIRGNCLFWWYQWKWWPSFFLNFLFIKMQKKNKKTTWHLTFTLYYKYTWGHVVSEESNVM